MPTHSGMGKVMEIFITFDPQVMKEDWLVRRDIPDELLRRHRFVVSYLYESMKTTGDSHRRVKSEYFSKHPFQDHW